MADGDSIATGGTTKPVIFISYSHKDEPEHPGADDIAWLTFVQSFLAPVVKTGIFDIWVDQHLHGGDDLDPEIKRKLAGCDIFVLLASRFSLASTYVVETEIATMRKRKAEGENVHLFPIVLSPIPNAALKQLKDLVLKPKDGKPLSLMSKNDREVAMAGIADDIAAVAEMAAKAKRTIKIASTPHMRSFAHDGMPKAIIGTPQAGIGWASPNRVPVTHVDIGHLPETAYERLVGRGAELKLLDQAWTDNKINIMSLIAEGGAGKSALVNEWLKRLQADSYRGAEAVLGWSFYSQGSKERATSADEFLNWALAKLGIGLETTSATAKAEAIAEAMMARRVLLVLDGVEPLQHGLDVQHGQLKDQGLRALLRRFASVPPAQAHGLIVLTSRLPVKDIARWKNSAAPVVDVERLSDTAGAALLRDNGVWGTDKELTRAAQDFGGHPLALALLASFLKETQFGDVRRRDHIRGLLHDTDNPRHDHAKRVMESYEREWLKDRPMLLAIMYLAGLFDRPASPDCLKALRRKPAITGLTEDLAGISDVEWQRAVTWLREVGLLAPADPATSGQLDTHPLVREWFGERLKGRSSRAWRAAHARIYEHLRRTTREGDSPTLEELAPLYQAVVHGCQAGLYRDTFKRIYEARICRNRNGAAVFYAATKLCAFGTNLAAISWFFDHPYSKPVASLPLGEQAWLLNEAGSCLSAQGRVGEALASLRASLQIYMNNNAQPHMVVAASNVGEAELVVGEVSAAIETSRFAIVERNNQTMGTARIGPRAVRAAAFHASGEYKKAQLLFAEAEQEQEAWQPELPLLYSLAGYYYCEFLLDKQEFSLAAERSARTLIWSIKSKFPRDIAHDKLALARSKLGLALQEARDPNGRGAAQANINTACRSLDEAVRGLMNAGEVRLSAQSLLARAAFRRSIGDWPGAARDLDEVEEIAEPGPMRLSLCDMALERGRLAFAKIKAFAPLNGLLEKDNPPKPVVPDAAEIAALKEEAAKQIAIAADTIESCGYHRRDEERDELQAVLRGERKFADLPPRV